MKPFMARNKKNMMSSDILASGTIKDPKVAIEIYIKAVEEDLLLIDRFSEIYQQWKNELAKAKEIRSQLEVIKPEDFIPINELGRLFLSCYLNNDYSRLAI